MTVARSCSVASDPCPTRRTTADPRTTTIYDLRRENFDRHAAYVVVAFVAGAYQAASRGGPSHSGDEF
jgi:hypothetical protein